MRELPNIISVDDHVVEPPHLWQDRLPARMREKGPRIERARWGDFALAAGASYKQEMTEDGAWGDYWVYEDRLIYVHKRHVAIPLDATPEGDPSRFDRSKMFIGALTYDEMRPGCYEPKARVEDLALTGVDGSIAFPTFPRFCGQTFMEGEDHELGLECVRAYNDFMIDEWCASSEGHLIPLCLIPLWDVELAVAEVLRNAARRPRHLLQRDPDAPRSPEHPHRLLGSAVRGVQRHAHDLVHAHRVVLEDAGRVTRCAAVHRHHAVVQQLDGIARGLPVLGRTGAVPRAEARLLRRSDRLDPVRARAGRQHVGVPLELDARKRRSRSRRRRTTAAASSGASPTTRTGWRRSTRSVRTTSASRPTTHTRTRRGRSHAKRSTA